MFERLSLEAFQSGLSWITVLRKRDNFRRAFHGFDVERIAKMDESDVQVLLADAGIIRNRAKIEATIANARAMLEIHRSERSLVNEFWARARLEAQGPASFTDMPPFSDDAKTLSEELKKAGFRFVGPTTVYSAMEATGVVNDHLVRCPVRDDVERERRDFLRSMGAANI